MGLQDTEEGLRACGYDIPYEGDARETKIECGARMVDDIDETPGFRSHDRDIYSTLKRCEKCPYFKNKVGYITEDRFFRFAMHRPECSKYKEYSLNIEEYQVEVKRYCKYLDNKFKVRRW